MQRLCLTTTPINNSLTVQVEGILTRKDLMGFAIEEKLERLLRHPHRKLSRSVVLALRKNYGQKMKKRPSTDNAAAGDTGGGGGAGGGGFVGFGDVADADGNGDVETGVAGETTRCLSGESSVDGGDGGGGGVHRKDSNANSDVTSEPNGIGLHSTSSETAHGNHVI